MTNVEALKMLYVALGGSAADVADATTIVGVLNAIATLFDGEDDAILNSDAITNIAAVAGNIRPESSNNMEIVGNPAVLAFPKNAKVVNLPEGITKIPSYYFQAANNLISISLPETLEEIGEWAFNGSSQLKEITIPANVSVIGASTFVNCSVLETISINKPEGSISGAPWGAPSTTQIIWNG